MFFLYQKLYWARHRKVEFCQVAGFFSLVAFSLQYKTEYIHTWKKFVHKCTFK